MLGKEHIIFRNVKETCQDFFYIFKKFHFFDNIKVSAQYFGEPEFMRTSLGNDWRWRNIQTSLLRAAKPRRYSHHGGEVYNSARNSP